MKNALKFLLVFLLLCLVVSAQVRIPGPGGSAPSGGGGGSIALVAHTGVPLGANGGGTGANPINTTGATLIVISLSGSATPAATVDISDSYSNTWTPLTPRDATGVDGTTRNQLYYCLSPIVGSGHTFVSGQNAQYSYIAIAAFSGVTAFDAQSGQPAGAGSTIQPGSITPAVANELFVTGIAHDPAGAAPTVGSSFTLLDADQGVGASSYAGGLAYKISSSAQNPTWTYSGGSTSAASQAAFKP